MRYAVLVLLIGCDRVFDISPVGDGPPPCSSSLAPGDYTPSQLLFSGMRSPTLPLDQQVMYLTSNGTVFYSRNVSGVWSPTIPIPSLDAVGFYEDRPSLTYDAQTLYFTRHLETGGFDQPYIAHRLDGNEEWEPATALDYPSAVMGDDVVFGVPNAAGDRIVASHGHVTHYHLAELALENGAWIALDTTANLMTTNDVSDTSPQLTPDGCAVIFSRIDRTTSSNHFVMLATRSGDGTFAAPQPLMTVPVLEDAQHPWLSPDGSAVYYFDQTGSGTTYVAHRH